MELCQEPVETNGSGWVAGAAHVPHEPEDGCFMYGFCAKKTNSL